MCECGNEELYKHKMVINVPSITYNVQLKTCLKTILKLPSEA